MRIFTSIRFRLILLVLLAILPLAGMSVYRIQEDRRSAGEQTAAGALNLARLAANNQQALVDQGQQLLFTLAQLDVVRAGDPAACNVLLARLLPNHPLYTNILVVNPDGRPRCSAIPLSGAVNYADRDWFQRAMQTRAFTIGSFVIGRITGKPSLPMAYPILDPHGQPQAMVVIALDLGWVSAMSAELDLPPGSTVTLVDTQGNVLGRYPDPENWLGKDVGAVPLIQHLLVHQSEGTIEDAGLDGVLRLYGYVPVQNGGQIWGYLFIGIPSQVAYAASDQTWKNSLIAFGLVAALALAAAWALGEFSIIRRTQALVRTAKRLAAGDQSVRTGMRYGLGEISQLGRAFDEMAETLQQRETERKRAAEALRESESFVKTVLDNLPIGIAVNSVDPTVTFDYMNDNFPKFYRTTREKLADPDAFWSAVYEEPAFREEMKKRVLDDFASGNPERMSWVDVPITRKGEETAFISARNIPIPDKPLTISTVWDVTERKRAEEEIRRRADEFAALYETSTALSAENDLNVLMQLIVERATTLLHAIAGGMYLYDPASEELEVVVATDPSIPIGTRLRLGEGVAGRVAQTRQPLRVEDYSNWEGRSPKYEGIPVRATIELPMLYRGELIGVLVVHETGASERKFTEADVRLLSLFATSAAGAVHNARLLEETLHQLGQLEALHSIDLAIRSSMDMRVTLNIFLEHVITQLKVDAADVLLLNPHLHTLEFSAGNGFRTKAFESAKLSLGEGYAGRAVLEHQAVHIPNLADQHDNPRFAKHLAVEGFVVYYGLPLVAKGLVVGVLEIFHRTPFTPDDSWLNFLEALAGQAAIAIDSAQLFENLQTSNTDLEAAYESNDSSPPSTRACSTSTSDQNLMRGEKLWPKSSTKR